MKLPGLILKLVLIIVSFNVVSSLVLAQKQNLVERIYEGVSKNENLVQARTEITAEAFEHISEDLMKEIIGEKKYTRNKAVIQNKIIKNSARYIPFSRPGEMKPEGDGFRMSIAIKVNLDDLQSLLLENGLFYESDGTPTVLPVVRWNDKSNAKAYVWWADKMDPSHVFLAEQNRNLETSLKSAFAKNQFYVQRPGLFQYSQILSAAFKSDHWTADDLQIVGQKMGVQIVVDGEVFISKSTERSEAQKIEIKLSAIQVMNGRTIAEVSRQFETETGSFEVVVEKKMKEVLEQASTDLSGQVFEAWSRGAIGASLYKLTVRGQIPLGQQEAFKEALKSKVREIKNIKERLISTEELVYELDSAMTPKDLALKLKDFEVSGLKFVVSSSNEIEIVYKLQKN